MLSAPDTVAFKAVRTAHEAKFAAFLEHIGRTDLCNTESRDSSAFAIQVLHIHSLLVISTNTVATLQSSSSRSTLGQSSPSATLLPQL